MNRPPLDLGLYLVADEIHFRKGAGEDQIVNAVKGGVRIVQLREKFCSTEEFIHLAERVLRALSPLGVPLLINDRVDVALKVGAQGVHLGQSDLDPGEARRLLGPEAVIGLSIETEHELLAGGLRSVDYLGVSSIFPTESKRDIKKVWGLEGLREVRSLTDLTLVGIGGIQESNLAQVVEAGADGIAIISAFHAQEDWKKKAEKLSEQFQKGRTCLLNGKGTRGR